MASDSVTITPDAQTSAAPVSITPDSTPAPRTWTNSVGDFASNLWKQISPIAGVKGAAQLTAHPIDTLKSDADARTEIYNSAESAFKKGNYAEGAAHLLNAAIPLLGPQMDAASNDFLQGNYAKGVGTSVGLGLNLAGPEAVKDAAMSIPGASQIQDAAQRVYQSALKPPPSWYTPEQTQAFVQTALDKKIPISETGSTKLQGLITDLNDNVQNQIKAGSAAGATVNKFDVASRLGQTYQKFGNQVTPLSDLNAIGETGNEFLQNQPNEIPAATAQQLKSGTYQQLNDTAYGQLKNSTIEAQKALARGIKEELQTQFPEIQGLNAQEGNAINLQEALERAINRTTNRNILGLNDAIISGAGAAGGAAIGGGAGALAGLTAGVLHHILTDPGVQSNLAIAMNSASKGKYSIPLAQARIAGYTNALGNSVAQQSGGNQQ
jgi:hypothetical protein